MDFKGTGFIVLYRNRTCSSRFLPILADVLLKASYNPLVRTLYFQLHENKPNILEIPQFQPKSSYYHKNFPLSL